LKAAQDMMARFICCPWSPSIHWLIQLSP